MEKFCPLKHSSTLHPESKHRYFKTVIKHNRNFKNVTKTLSGKHEFMRKLNLTEHKQQRNVTLTNAI